MKECKRRSGEKFKRIYAGCYAAGPGYGGINVEAKIIIWPEAGLRYHYQSSILSYAAGRPHGSAICQISPAATFKYHTY